MADDDHPTQNPGECVQFVNHFLSALIIEAAKTLIDDETANSADSRGVLADPGRERHGNPELLAARQKRDVECILAGPKVNNVDLDVLSSARRLTLEQQTQLTSRNATQSFVRERTDSGNGLVHEQGLQSGSAQEIREPTE